MDSSTYYRDHWIDIESDRLEAYDEMFRWRPEMDPLIAPAAIAAGQTVLDFGCGPGWLVVELARRVTDTGHVHGVDLNAAFLARASQHVREAGVERRVTLHTIDGHTIPLADAEVDRVVTKNVLEYVPSVDAAMHEFRRVLRPGGLLHVVDSDWGMFAVEPIGAERIAELFAAASVAYKTPLIGRKLFGAMRAAGFRDVRVQILASADTRGHFAPILNNMASYARAAGTFPEAKIDAILADLKQAIASQSYLLVLPQFLVTGAR